MKTQKNNKGFSLIEMLVVVSMFAVIIAGSSQILIMVMKHNNKAESMLTIHEIGDNIITRMNRKIMPAAGLATGQSCDPPASYPPGSGNRIINLMRIDRAGLSFGCDVAAGSDNGRIYFIDNLITTELINNDRVVVQACEFSCHNNYVIDFRFTLGLGDENETFLTSIAMRNADNR